MSNETNKLGDMQAKFESEYAKVWRTSPPEFLAHYAAISKVAGMDVPESHSAAVAETASANTWRESYRMAVGRFILLAFAQLAFLAFALWRHLPTHVVALGPVAITLAFTGWVRFMQYVITEGADEMWEKRSFAMKEYLGTVVEGVERKAEQDERRNLR